MKSKEYADATVRRHLSECLRLSDALTMFDDERMHEFRLACKRLRFSIERFAETLPASLTEKTEALSAITDELGSAHDCVLLVEHARKLEARTVVWRALQDRSRYFKRANEMWQALLPGLQQAAAVLRGA